VVGATVTATDPVTGQTFTAISDQQGRYKIEGLPAGAYSVVVAATGFSDARREEVRVEEGKAATLDMKLDIAPVEATVNVSTVKANTDSTYQQLRQQAKTEGDFAGPFATVSNLVLKRDAATFTLKTGEIYFLPQVQDRTFGAVFLGEGEFSLTPPTDIEKHTLSLFTKEPTINESFTRLVLHFTDKSFEEIKASPSVQMGSNGAHAGQAQDAYHENQTLCERLCRRTSNCASSWISIIHSGRVLHCLH
jgi:hypothetical protein